MTITLWTIFEILINFYQGGLETWFIYKFLTPRSHERAKIWAVIFAVCEGCLIVLTIKTFLNLTKKRSLVLM